ncbi:alanine racemase [uncultured Clostridium sp.]|jgi:alanine racemase|uniref:alanine racemase n=1 Tax=uncultured Clostridium sp. TaxID=59620 RepID=UPI00261033D5|nr:alanine racemase [uncultured Clostridium sp.]
MNFWCEVYLNRLENNIEKIKKLTKEKSLIGVIKGDAYGLGLADIANFIEDKVDIIAVADIEEANKVSYETDVLILSPLCQETCFSHNRKNLILSIDNKEILNSISKDEEYRVHIYLDTGMNRMGIKPVELDEFIKYIKTNYTNVKIEGLYTHLHKAADEEYTLRQIAVFKNATEKYNGEIPLIHCLASSGIINDKLREAASFTTAVRAGNILYGYIGAGKGMQKVFDYYAKAVSVYEIKNGETVGYGAKYKANKDMTVGILPVGNVQGLGVTREIHKNIVYDVVRAFIRSFKERPIIYQEKNAVQVLGKPNMNVTIIDFENYNKDSKFKLEMSPIISNSLVEKKYILE